MREKVIKLARHMVVGVVFIALLSACVTGSGGFSKGGRIDDIFITPTATATHGAPYQIVCPQTKKARVSMLVAIFTPDEPSEMEENKAPDVRYVNPEEYDGSCSVEGESSTFMLFNFIPATDPLNAEYAIAMAVQKLEGDTMINIRAWHEINYYSILGRAVVFKVRGDVIKFVQQQGKNGGKK